MFLIFTRSFFFLNNENKEKGKSKKLWYKLITTLTINLNKFSIYVRISFSIFLPPVKIRNVSFYDIHIFFRKSKISFLSNSPFVKSKKIKKEMKKKEKRKKDIKTSYLECISLV